LSEFNTDKAIFTEALEFAKDSILFLLLKDGINSNIIEPIINRITQAIISGENLSDLITELDTMIKGEKAITTDKRIKKGIMERYLNTILTDSMNQYSANHNLAVSNELGLEFFLYEGGRSKDSRPFCIRYKNKYYHREEVEKLGERSPEDPFTGLKLSTLSTKGRNLLQGRIPGTTPGNIFVRRGGYNCVHQFIGVTPSQVPKTTLDRAIKKGMFKPTEKQRKSLNL